jgi:alkaline phosphatase
MRRAIVICALIVGAISGAYAQTIYPVDRAEILAGARFDVKVEFDGPVAPSDVKLTVNGTDYATVFGKSAQVIEREDGKDQSALILRDATITKPGRYVVRLATPNGAREIAWTVYDTQKRVAKNVVLMIGDGMSQAHRTAARLLSKGIAEGKAFGKLAMDDMPHMALVATAGIDSIVTDSANSASAYATGHKTAARALGVYADRTKDPLDDPRVETIASLAKRRYGMAIGLVTDADIADATPAAMIAHTGRRATFDNIVEQYFAAKPDVLLGGGLGHFLPYGTAGSRRRDGIDYVAQFKQGGYAVVTNATALKALPDDTKRLLGLFNFGDMDGVLDRKFLKKGTVERFPDQPDLTEMTAKALAILSRDPNGFFLMVEAGMIDKYTHRLDMERAVYDTIMFDNTVRLVRDFAKAHGDDTLILVVADHSHPVSIIGTIDSEAAGEQKPERERLRFYGRAGFPNYPAPNAEGYPPGVDAGRKLLFSPGPPDHLPRLSKSSVHSGEDAILTAIGPGSEAVRGQLDNTEVFRVIAEALGLGVGTAEAAAKPR